MIPELGQLALAIAFCLSVAITWFGLAGAATGRAHWVNALGSMVSGQFVFMLLAYVALTWAFLTDDFSVAYVANNSNTLLPWYYKMSAVWGAHEGSFLLWVLIMTGWTLAVALRGGHLPMDFLGRVLGIMGLLNLGFLAFLIWPSNPFDRLVPMTPAEGSDLNPLLQDFGLIVHPPMLYMGYVGFSVAFAFAVAALLSGRLDAAWARWSRPWSNVAWAFLTLGIVLGSWWAYYELGWGGWWFWDPVENASFMPWLVGTALIHSLAVSEKRGTFKSWTLLLAITTFSLSLLGAFIVRSGVLTSVHAFAVDPTRGMFILIFLLLVVGGSLTLYAARATVIRSRARFTLWSREAFLLLNNLLLVIAMALVLLGTLYPLAYEAVSGGDKISVGVPYFNAGFVPLMLALAAALGIAPVLQWKRTRPERLVRSLGWILAASLLLGLAVPLLASGAVPWAAVPAVVVGLWVLGSHLNDVRKRVRLGLRRIPAAYWGMLTAHVGFAVALLGVALTSVMSVERDLRMSPGQVLEVSGLTVRFDGVGPRNGPNFIAERGSFVITEDGRDIVLHPEKRRYLAGDNVMTEAAISPGFTRDIYVSLGEPLGNGDWAVRVQHKPFVRWIWLGGLLMAFGGALAVADGRYRRLRRHAADAAVDAGTAPSSSLPPGKAAEART
ncbi:MAG: heme lyase CcmF/NrfE family subunit [Pseudomonadales bacterium]